MSKQQELDLAFVEVVLTELTHASEFYRTVRRNSTRQNQALNDALEAIGCSYQALCSTHRRLGT